MRRYEFKESDYSAEPMNGEPPESIPGAIGEVIVSFESLDDQISTAIGFLLRRGDDVGRIVTAEVSFKAKVNLLGSLFRLERPKSSWMEQLNELCAACHQIEEHRNRVAHSKWSHAAEWPAMTRQKWTARAKQGLQHQTEEVQPSRVRAIGFHCGFLAHSVDELMFGEFGEEYGTW